MQCLGIDVGTDSARLYVPGKEKASYYETPLVRTSNGRHHTMSAESLWESIMSMIANEENIYKDLQLSFEKHGLDGGNTGPVQPYSLGGHGSPGPKDPLPRYGISIGATCSMVIMQRVFEDGRYFFRPLDRGHEILVWMDTRAQQEAELATKLLPDWALQQIGGSATPEMGIVKLLWVDQKYKALGKDVCVFELYDWLSYMFLSGGYHEGRVRCLAGDVPSFGPGKSAMDGSVKGWGADILHALAVGVKVAVTPNFFNPAVEFPHVGAPLGTIGDFIVGHGCIDCYAPWAGLVASSEHFGDDVYLPVSEPPQCHLLIVAGTSTCCIASCESSSPIKGFWGPFLQLLPQPVYSFGQPATGQLFSELVSDFSHIVPPNEDPFAFMEHHACVLEAKYNAPLTVLARHYFYYGDKHGNRSPYGDFSMGEVFADGVNGAAENTFQCSLGDKSLEALVLRYYLILEFLVLQTAQLCASLKTTGGSISTVHLEGSQAQNKRFVQLLKGFVFPDSQLFVRTDSTSKYSGCRGIAAALSRNLLPSTVTGDAWCEISSVNSGIQHRSVVQDVLAAKHQAFLQLAQWQASFRQKMKRLDGR